MIAGFQAMPLWAQVGVALFALTFVAMVVSPGLTKRKFRRHLDALARALGRPPSTSRDWPYSVQVSAGERSFELRYDLRSTSKTGSYRGPTGHLLITTTRLAGTRWPLHQVDIGRVDGWLSKLVSGKRATGDPDFDPRFIVTEDGMPVREGWLDEKTRRAIGQFFEGAPPGGLIWVREGELQYIMQPSWPASDGVAVRALLERQAALANALEQTAR